MDLARKNRIISILKEAVVETFPDNEIVEKAIAKFEENHDGLVPEPFIIETDKEVSDPETEIMPEIRKEYPEAIFLSCEKMPVSQIK
jgi:hypothetical protein